MCVNQREYEELLSALDRSIAIFGDRPQEEGFDLTVYEELRRVRETLIRARRDQYDPNLQSSATPLPDSLPKPAAPIKPATKKKRDSKSPLGA
jgi:hypothetical protein